MLPRSIGSRSAGRYRAASPATRACSTPVKHSTKLPARALREGLMNPVGDDVENVLLSVILQLVLIIAAARTSGLLFRRVGQPQVCGEIAAGLILGPSVLGRIFPAITASLFQGMVGPV